MKGNKDRNRWKSHPVFLLYLAVLAVAFGVMLGNVGAEGIMVLGILCSAIVFVSYYENQAPQDKDRIQDEESPSGIEPGLECPLGK